MVNVSEGMIKIANKNRRKRMIRLNQNGNGSRRLYSLFIISQSISFQVNSSHLKFHALILETWKPCIAPFSEEKFPAKETDSSAGLGPEFTKPKIDTVRLHVYQVPAKLITGRKLLLAVPRVYYKLIQNIRNNILLLEPSP